MAAGASEIDLVLLKWRLRASHTLLVVSSIAYLPVLLLALAGHLPWAPPVAVAAASCAYAVLLVVTLVRGANHAVRVWVALGAGYVLSVVGAYSVPDGPLVRSMPVVLPILALVLVGPRSGRAAMAVSAAVLLLAPLFDADQSPRRLPLAALPMLGMMLGVMAVLDAFQRFVVQALVSERKAARERDEEIGRRRRLEGELAGAADEERRRLGHDLHDGVCQQMTGALLRCQALERAVQRGGSVPSAELAALSGLLEASIDDAHAVAQGLIPLRPEPEALAHALHAAVRQVQRTGLVRCEFRTSGDVRVHDPRAAQHLYRIGQEAFSNAVRHARATRIEVELRGLPGEVVVCVTDDGVGLPVTPGADGMGLRTMAYRAQALGARLVLGSAAPKGAVVECGLARERCAKTPAAAGPTGRDHPE